MEIRMSLDYKIWAYHSFSLSLAGNENLKLFEEQKSLKSFEKNENLLYGLLNSTNLIYATSIETIIKARVLFNEIEKIKSQEIKSFKQLRNQWSGNGHNVFDIMNLYGISFSAKEEKVLLDLEPYMSWAGRFPFPLHESEVKKYESLEKRLKLNFKKIIIVEEFLKRQQKEMNL